MRTEPNSAFISCLPGFSVKGTNFVLPTAFKDAKNKGRERDVWKGSEKNRAVEGFQGCRLSDIVQLLPVQPGW